MPLETEYLGYVWKKDKCKARILQSLYTIVCGKLSKKTPEGTYIWKYEQRKKSDLLLKCSQKYPHSTEQLTGRNVSSWEMKSFPNWSSPDCDFISSSSSTSFLHPPSSSATASTDTLGHTERYGDYTLAFSPPLSSLTLSFYPYSFPSPSFILLSFYCYRPSFFSFPIFSISFPPFLHVLSISISFNCPFLSHLLASSRWGSSVWNFSSLGQSLSHTYIQHTEPHVNNEYTTLHHQFLLQETFVAKVTAKVFSYLHVMWLGWAFSQAIYSLHTEVL